MMITCVERKGWFWCYFVDLLRFAHLLIDVVPDVFSYGTDLVRRTCFATQESMQNNICSTPKAAFSTVCLWFVIGFSTTFLRTKSHAISKRTHAHTTFIRVCHRVVDGPESVSSSSRCAICPLKRTPPVHATVRV